MKVLKDFNNKLCKRVEYTIEVNHINNKTPSKIEIKKKIADITNSDESLIKLKGIYTKYGFGRSITHAYVYTDEKSYKCFEVKNKRKSGKKEKNKRKEEAKK